MRAGFGEERRELHSTHSLQGKLAVFTRAARSLSAGRCCRGTCRWGCRLHFQSTLYSWWFFMGGWLVRAHAVRAARACVERASRTARRTDHRDHFHDIGKLCFAFTAFWGYLTFGQYLVIWYGNMGEETFFIASGSSRRGSG